MKREINEYDLPLMAMSKETSRVFDGQMNTGMALWCPKCGCERIARIIWGNPVYYEGLIQEFDEGRVYIRGCCNTGDDQEWHCNECGAEY